LQDSLYSNLQKNAFHSSHSFNLSQQRPLKANRIKLSNIIVFVYTINSQDYGLFIQFN